MKVKDLIKQLGYMNAEAEVHFTYNYGDHWHTTVAPVVGQVYEGAVKFSEYHRMDKLVEDEDDWYDEKTGNINSDIKQVVILVG
jgi:hypothetical protein